MQTGKRVYDQSCALCHSSEDSGAPPRETLAQMPRDKIANALKTGVMQAIARQLQLESADIDAVATFLTSTGATP